MAEITKTEISTYDMPGQLINGTGKRRVNVKVRGTSAANSNTLDLSTYISGFGAIESINSEMVDGKIANAASANTYATTIITFAGHGGSGAWILDVTGTMT